MSSENNEQLRPSPPSSFDFRLAVFDLDLTLFDGMKLFEDVHSILSRLKADGVKLYIASFHLEAADCCKFLGIAHYFEDILYGRNRTKAEMIQDILGRHSGMRGYNTVFFDDNFENILDVKIKTGIRTIHIDRFGLTWTDVPVKFSMCSASANIYNSFNDFQLEDRCEVNFRTNIKFDEFEY